MRGAQASGWQIGPVSIITGTGRHDLAGWTNGLFGLDFRAADGRAEDEGCPWVWNLTHLPTGRSVCSIYAPLDEAQSFVAMLQASADWNFDETEDSRTHGQAFASVREAFGSENIYRGTDSHAPSLTSRVSTPLNEQGRGE